MIADLLFVAGLLALAVFIAASDPRVRRRPAIALPQETALSAEIDVRIAALRESRDATNRALAELHARGERLDKSIGRRGLRELRGGRA